MRNEKTTPAGVYEISVDVQYHLLALTREGTVSEELWNRGDEIARLTPEGIQGHTSIHTGSVTLTVSMEDGPVPTPAGHEFSTTLDRFTADQAQLHVLTWSEPHDPIVLPDSFLGTPLTVQWSATRIPEYWDPAAPPAEKHHVAIWRTDAATT